MTAIGAWWWDGLPVLVGDLATSGPEEDSVAFLPTVKSVESRFPRGSAFVVKGALQKLGVFCDGLATGWCGSAIAAAEAFGILDSLDARDISASNIEKSLGGLSSSRATRDLILLGWFCESGVWQRFVFENGRFQVANHDGPEARGSGKDALLGAYAWSSRALLPESTPPRLGNAVRAVMATGHLMQVELSSAKGLLEYFGGGYEIVSIVQDQLKKVDVATHLFWDAEIIEAELRLRPQRVLRNFYQDRRLLVRAADLEFQELPNVLRLEDDGIHIIGRPGDRRFDTTERLTIRSFAAPIVANHARVRSDGVSRWIAQSVSTATGQLTELPDGKLMIAEQFYESVRDTIRRAVAAQESA